MRFPHCRTNRRRHAGHSCAVIPSSIDGRGVVFLLLFSDLGKDPLMKEQALPLPRTSNMNRTVHYTRVGAFD
jgi:hypothetical protein